ncbi:hypothetical protein HGA34_02975 [Candidatus Falkowbacteria bacterium]|nr:hypothetical protein [Candidatus Falkowbacteria bacterium]
MKTVQLFLLTLALAALNGCALVTPPPFVNSTTEITRDANGNIVSSRYHRGITGFSYSGDKESVGDWAYAEQIARNGKSGSLSEHTGEFKGIIASTDRDVNVVITGNGLKRSFYVKAGQEISGTLPSGKYTATTYYRGKSRGSWDFEVRPQNLHSYAGKEVHWYTVYNR